MLVAHKILLGQIFCSPGVPVHYILDRGYQFTTFLTLVPVFLAGAADAHIYTTAYSVRSGSYLRIVPSRFRVDNWLFFQSVVN